MSEQPQHNDSLPPASAEQDVVVLIKKMQQQLVFLEKKIDILISQSQERPFSKEQHFSRPFRSFGRPHRPSGEKSFDRERPFEKRHGEEDRGFGYKKKSYGHTRGSDFSQERHFEKRHDGEKRGFDPKKKPFFHKRKDRG